MKWKAEIAVYVLLCLAALPLAWAAFDLFVYYASNPESLQERETHRDALLVFAVMPFVLFALVPAAVLAWFLLIFCGNITRGVIVVLVGFYFVLFNIQPQFPINTIANLAWDALVTSLLVVAPLLLLAIRSRQNRAPNHRLNRTRADNARAG